MSQLRSRHEHVAAGEPNFTDCARRDDRQDDHQTTPSLGLSIAPPRRAMRNGRRSASASTVCATIVRSQRTRSRVCAGAQPFVRLLWSRALCRFCARLLEELVFRSWAVAMSGGYVTHGETYYSDDETLFWAKGRDAPWREPSTIGVPPGDHRAIAHPQNRSPPVGLRRRAEPLMTQGSRTGAMSS